MKKIFVLFIIFIGLIFLVSCDFHIHYYKKIESRNGMIKAPTCTTYGEYKSICSCGRLGRTTFTGTTLLEHDLETIEEVVDEENDLIYIAHKHCKTCDQNFDENIELLPTTTKKIEHAFSEYHEGVQATCEKSGSLGYYYCSHCNKYYDKDYKLITNLSIYPIGHKYGEYIQVGGMHQRICLNDSTHIEEELCTFTDWNITIQATAFTKGLRSCTCTLCGYVKEEEIKELHIHEFSTEWTIDIEPKCEVNGIKSHHCLTDGCLEIQDETIIPALNHDYSDWNNTIKVTCTTNGERIRTCERCKKEEKEVVILTGHEYLGVDTLPTCLEKGYTTYTCSKCEDTYVNNYKNALGHDLINHEKVLATCISVGNEAYDTCNRCDYSTYVEIPMIEHDYSVSLASFDHIKSKATCYSKALYYISCSICKGNSNNTFEYGEVLEHKFAAKVDSKYLINNATCTTYASYYKSCQNCGLASTTDTFQAGNLLDHNYIEVVDDDYLFKPATCDSKAMYYTSCKDCHVLSKNLFEDGDPLTHDYRSVVSDDYLKVGVSCTNKACYYKSCVLCHKTIDETFEFGEMLPHTYTNKISNDYLISSATCTNKASYYESCSTCGQVGTNSFETGLPLGHNLLHEPAKPATPTEDGYRKYEYCTRCDYTTKVIIQYGIHTYSELINQITSSDGIKYKVDKCIDCSAFNIYDEFSNNISDPLLQYTTLEGYKALESFENGENFQKDYLTILGKLLRVHTSTTDYSLNYQITCDLLVQLNSSNETQSVFATIDSDWPILFWKTSTTSTSSKQIIVYLDNDYCLYNNRINAWNTCVNGINQLVTSAENNILYPTEISKVKYVYDTIMDNTEYAFVEGTTTPDPRTKAHSIYGYFSGSNCVCEGYSKTLQVVLNKLGINTYYLTGNVNGGGHAWNYITINSKTYFVDITWDDKENRDYTNFLLGNISVSEMTNRILSPNNINNGIYFNPVIPKLYDYDYSICTVYENSMLLNKFESIEDAYNAMTDSTKDYKLYLFDVDNSLGNNIPYGVFNQNFIIDFSLFKNVNSLSIIGYGDGISRSNTNIILDVNSPLKSNLIFEKVYFLMDNNIIQTPSNYLTINIGTYDISFNYCSGYLNYNISGTGNVYINNALKIDTTKEYFVMLGITNVNTFEVNDCTILYMNNLTTTNLNLNGIINFVQGWEFCVISNINITNIYVNSTDSYIFLQGSAVNNIINLNITNISGTKNLRIDTYFSNINQVPYITISGDVDCKVQLCICGSINGYYLNSNLTYTNSLFTISSTCWNKVEFYTMKNGSLYYSKNDIEYDTNTNKVYFKQK